MAPAPAVATREATGDRRKLRPTKAIGKTEAKNKTKRKKIDRVDGQEAAVSKTARNVTLYPTASQQLTFFVNQYQYANDAQLSSLEIELLKESCFIELSEGPMVKFDEHVKTAFKSSWKEVLCERKLPESQIDPGSPAVLVISSSAIRSLELLRDLRSLTKECHAAKLFSKHMKIEEQVSVLKNRVNIASGTPSRIKKLIDMEALGLSRLAVIVIDMQIDVKGYSLFTLKQISGDFWDLYRSYFHQSLLQGKLRILLHGPIPVDSDRRKIKHDGH